MLCTILLIKHKRIEYSSARKSLASCLLYCIGNHEDNKNHISAKKVLHIFKKFCKLRHLANSIAKSGYLKHSLLWVYPQDYLSLGFVAIFHLVKVSNKRVGTLIKLNYRLLLNKENQKIECTFVICDLSFFDDVLSRESYFTFCKIGLIKNCAGSSPALGTK